MSKPKTQLKIGENIKTARLKLGATQGDIAKKAKISVNYYARIERGEVNASIETLESVLRALNVKSSNILPF